MNHHLVIAAAQLSRIDARAAAGMPMDEIEAIVVSAVGSRPQTPGASAARPCSAPRMPAAPGD